jgi:hypothetical protein
MQCYGFLENIMLVPSCWFNVVSTLGFHQITASEKVADYLSALFASVQIDYVNVLVPLSAFLKASWSLTSFPLKIGLHSFLLPSFSSLAYEQPHAACCSFYA